MLLYFAATYLSSVTYLSTSYWYISFQNIIFILVTIVFVSVFTCIIFSAWFVAMVFLFMLCGLISFFLLYARWHPFYPSVLLQCWLHFVCLDFLWLCASVSSAGKLQCIFLDNCCNSKMYFAIYRLPSCVQAQRASYRLEGCVFNFLNYSDSSQKVLFTKKLTLLMSALIAQIYKSSATWIFAFCEFTPEIF